MMLLHQTLPNLSSSRFLFVHLNIFQLHSNAFFVMYLPLDFSGNTESIEGVM